MFVRWDLSPAVKCGHKGTKNRNGYKVNRVARERFGRRTLNRLAVYRRLPEFFIFRIKSTSMKKSFTAFSLFLFFHLLSFGQTINNVPLKEIDVEYIEIVGTPTVFSTKFTIELDFGQANKFWSNKEYDLRDADGKRIKFNSMIDALNFMGKNGYELITPYIVPGTNSSSGSVYHYLLRRKKLQ